MIDNNPTLGQYIEPAPVHFTFDAPGWYVVGVVVILLLLLTLFFILRRYYKNRYRRHAIKQLQQQAARLTGQQKYADIIYTANMIMKQICMHLYSREACADLREREWLNFLNQTSRHTIFQTEDENALAMLYLDDNILTEKDAGAFADKTILWIKKYKHADRRSK